MDPQHPAFRRTITQAAVAILTEQLDDPDARHQLSDTELGRIIEDNDLTDPQLMIGMTNVASWLLFGKLAKVGRDPVDVLRELGSMAASLENRPQPG